MTDGCQWDTRRDKGNFFMSYQRLCRSLGLPPSVIPVISQLRRAVSCEGATHLVCFVPPSLLLHMDLLSEAGRPGTFTHIRHSMKLRKNLCSSAYTNPAFSLNTLGLKPDFFEKRLTGWLFFLIRYLAGFVWVSENNIFWMTTNSTNDDHIGSEPVTSENSEQ